MEPSAAGICREHLQFMAWADTLLTAAVAQSTPEAVTPLQHVYLGEVVWLERVSGNEAAQITQYAAPESIHELSTAFREIHAKWLAWANAFEDFDTVVPHRNLKGESFRMPAWQIVLHLVNHGSYHRGQVAAQLRSSGFAPPATDLIIWYRTQRAQSSLPPSRPLNESRTPC
jgi:uncharacterized damage-inducible protein DinB